MSTILIGFSSPQSRDNLKKICGVDGETNYTKINTESVKILGFGHLSIVSENDKRICVTNHIGNNFLEIERFISVSPHPCSRLSEPSEIKNNPPSSNTSLSLEDSTEEDVKIKINFDDQILLYGKLGVYLIKDNTNDTFCNLELIYINPVIDVCYVHDKIYAIDDNYHFGVIEDTHTMKHILCDGKIISNCLEIQGGYEHLVILTKDGKIYTYGCGTRGQIGCGYVELQVEEAFYIESLNFVKPVKIACGGWHTLIISDIGDVYGWGWNESSQLGISEPSVIASPKLIEMCDSDLNFIDFQYIAAGSQHSAALDVNGNVWTWGSNEFGQTGDSVDKTIFPKKVSIKEQTKIAKDIKCGRWTTLLIY